MSRILVIEDDTTTRALIVKHLERDGYIVLEADNGEDGAKLASKEVPDLIVCDVQMPRLDGFGTLLRVRDNPKTQLIPFVFLTSQSNIEEMRKGMELGADDFLPKPFRPNNLLSSIAQRLERVQLQKLDSARQQNELTLSIAASIPQDIESAIERIASFTNLLALKHKDADPQVLQARDAMLNETRVLKRFIRRLHLYGRLPELTRERSRSAEILQSAPVPAHIVLKQTAEDTAKRLGLASGIRLDIAKANLHIDRQYLEVIVDELCTHCLQSADPSQPVALKSEIQEPFYAIELSFKPDAKRIQNPKSIGADIGITLARGLALLHNGSFSIEKQNIAQTATVRFPLPRIG